MQSQYLGLENNLSIREELANHWDEKLKPDDDNPYPLAPKDLVRRGLVTRENYADENGKFGRFCSSIMREELNLLGHSIGFSEIVLPQIEVLGAGLARDLNWISDAVKTGFGVKVYDISNVACEYVENRFEGSIQQGLVRVVNGEAEEMWEEWQVDSERIIACFASQFIQVQKKRKMQKILRFLGSFLEKKVGKVKLSRQIYFMHPYRKDNTGPKVWDNEELPEVVWGDTTPYDEEEIKCELEKGSSRKVKIDVLGKHHYYHQEYSFLKIMTIE